MQKFKILILSIFFILPSTMFGIVGFGMNIIQDGTKLGGAVNEEGSGLSIATVESFEMEDLPVGFGVYGFIDLAGWAIEYEGNIVGQKYNFSFSNALSTLEEAPFVWARNSNGVTIKKNIADFSIPLLAKTALSFGVGFMSHSTTPRPSVSMLKDILQADDLTTASFTADGLESQIVSYLEDNLEKSSGTHAQLGLRFKILVVDAHLNFRYNIADNVYEGSDGYTEIQFKLGMGF